MFTKTSESINPLGPYQIMKCKIHAEIQRQILVVLSNLHIRYILFPLIFKSSSTYSINPMLIRGLMLEILSRPFGWHMRSASLFLYLLFPFVTFVCVYQFFLSLHSWLRNSCYIGVQRVLSNYNLELNWSSMLNKQTGDTIKYMKKYRDLFWWFSPT